jgi:cyclic pyranopterin phosphate synthase
MGGHTLVYLPKYVAPDDPLFEASDDDLRAAIAAVWRVRDDRYSDLRTEATSDLPRVEMFAMGG